MKKLASAFLLSAAVHAAALLCPDGFRSEPPEEAALPVLLLVEERAAAPESRSEKPAYPARRADIPPSVETARPEESDPLERAAPVTTAKAPESPPQIRERMTPSEARTAPAERAATEAVGSGAGEPVELAVVEEWAVPEPVRKATTFTPASLAAPNDASGQGSSPAGPVEVQVRYAFTPVPEYPRRARDRGLEGRVLLRVLVSSEGTAEKVEVKDSSGFSMLDSAAVKSVRRWRFHPAREGEERVPMWIRVPVEFRLATAGE
jgi:protein TonB